MAMNPMIVSMSVKKENKLNLQIQGKLEKKKVKTAESDRSSVMGKTSLVHKKPVFLRIILGGKRNRWII